MICNFFDYYWVTKGYFDPRGTRYDDVIKIGYSRPSWNNCILR